MSSSVTPETKGGLPPVSPKPPTVQKPFVVEGLSELFSSSAPILTLSPPDLSSKVESLSLELEDDSPPSSPRLDKSLHKSEEDETEEVKQPPKEPKGKEEEVVEMARSPKRPPLPPRDDTRAQKLPVDQMFAPEATKNETEKTEPVAPKKRDWALIAVIVTVALVGLFAVFSGLCAAKIFPPALLGGVVGSAISTTGGLVLGIMGGSYIFYRLKVNPR